MSHFLRPIGAAILLTSIAAAAPVRAATVNDFYLSLLRRGVDHVTAGNYEAASTELKVAAFGLLDSVELYETAQIYLAIASQHLGREAQARAAATHVVAAERVEPHYIKLSLPDPIRKEFEAIAQKVLAASQLETLRKR